MKEDFLESNYLVLQKPEIANDLKIFLNHPNARGFDDFYGFCSGHWGNYFSPVLEHNGEIVKGNGFVVDDFTDRGMAYNLKHEKTNHC